jgi:hypothetical protein
MEEKYAELLRELDIPVDNADIIRREPEPKVHKCKYEGAEPVESGVYTVCDGCGLVLAVDMIEHEPPQFKQRRLYRHEDSRCLGADEDSYMPRRRFYKPLTHFRQHLRAYLYAGSCNLDAKVVEHMRKNVDVEDRNAYQLVKQELKKLGLQKHYRDVFSIIYSIGGRKPDVTAAQAESMCYYFKRWCYHYNQQDRFGKHNTPSIYMLLDIILKEYGHEPYYYIPTLKSDKLRERVLDIYDQVKKQCFPS